MLLKTMYDLDDITNKSNDVLDKIIEIFFEKNISEALELCRKFYAEYSRAPYENEVYEGFKIGEFVNFVMSDSESSETESSYSEED